MNNSQRGLGGLELIIATLAALVVAACGTRTNQSQLSNVEAAPATQLVQQNASGGSLEPAAAHLSTRHVSHHELASDKQNTASNDERTPTGNTAAVLSQMHQADLTEIALGKLAENKASAPEVRAYADQLVLDHTNIDRTVMAMAQKKGAHLRDQAASLRRLRNGVQTSGQFERKLTSASGSKFDHLFLQQAGSDHQRLIQKLQQDREDANDDEIEALIDKIVPILEQHRELAQILMKKETA
jgi:putative membrane protein